jgi:hypothetical protein
MDSISRPFAFENVSAGVLEAAEAGPLIGVPVARVKVSVWVGHGAVAVLDAQFPLALVGATVGLLQLSEPVRFELGPLTSERVTVRVGDRAGP